MRKPTPTDTSPIVDTAISSHHRSRRGKHRVDFLLFLFRCFQTLPTGDIVVQLLYNRVKSYLSSDPRPGGAAFNHAESGFLFNVRTTMPHALSDMHPIESML